MILMNDGWELSGLEWCLRDTRDETGDEWEEGREENREGKWQQSDGRRFSQNPNPDFLKGAAHLHVPWRDCF
jgi:hypothetical protein